MDAAQVIRDSVQSVARLRDAAAGDAQLHQALLAVKRLQSRRFSGLYADLLRGGVYEPAAQFFLQELYGDKDYARRDEQFARIAPAIEKFFPAHVARTAAALARLHALTEDLDLRIARLWVLRPDIPDEARRYVLAWRDLGAREQREAQLASVLALGEELARLTRWPGLRTMLRLMRGPAGAAGLGDLQNFLETGFDTFAGMSRRPGVVEQFLETVRERESRLLTLLYDEDLVACGTELARILGQAP